MKILKFFRVMGKGDPTISEEVSSVLATVRKRKKRRYSITFVSFNYFKLNSFFFQTNNSINCFF